jgi:hypothetical protein
MDIREIVWEVVDWIHLAQDTDCCERGNEPSGYVKGEKFLLAEWMLAFQEGLYSMELVGWLVGWLVS